MDRPESRDMVTAMVISRTPERKMSLLMQKILRVCFRLSLLLRCVEFLSGNHVSSLGNFCVTILVYASWRGFVGNGLSRRALWNLKIGGRGGQTEKALQKRTGSQSSAITCFFLRHKQKQSPAAWGAAQHNQVHGEVGVGNNIKAVWSPEKNAGGTVARRRSSTSGCRIPSTSSLCARSNACRGLSSGAPFSSPKHEPVKGAKKASWSRSTSSAENATASWRDTISQTTAQSCISTLFLHEARRSREFHDSCQDTMRQKAKQSSSVVSAVSSRSDGEDDQLALREDRDQLQRSITSASQVADDVDENAQSFVEAVHRNLYSMQSDSLDQLVHEVFEFDELCSALVHDQLKPTGQWKTALQTAVETEDLARVENSKVNSGSDKSLSAASDTSCLFRSRATSSVAIISSPRSRTPVTTRRRYLLAAGASSGARIRRQRTADTCEDTSRARELAVAEHSCIHTGKIKQEDLPCENILPYAGILSSRGWLVLKLNLERMRADGYRIGDREVALLKRAVESILFQEAAKIEPAAEVEEGPAAPLHLLAASTSTERNPDDLEVEDSSAKTHLTWRFSTHDFVRRSGVLNKWMQAYLNKHFTAAVNAIVERTSNEGRASSKASLHEVDAVAHVNHRLFAIADDVDIKFSAEVRDGVQNGSFRDAYHPVICEQVVQNCRGKVGTQPNPFFHQLVCSRLLRTQIENRNLLRRFSWTPLSKVDVRVRLSAAGIAVLSGLPQSSSTSNVGAGGGPCGVDVEFAQGLAAKVVAIIFEEAAGVKVVQILRQAASDNLISRGEGAEGDKHQNEGDVEHLDLVVTFPLRPNSLLSSAMLTKGEVAEKDMAASTRTTGGAANDENDG